MELKKLSWLHRYQYDLLPKEYKELKNEYNSLTTSLSKKIKRYDKIKNEIEVLRNNIRIGSKKHNQLYNKLEFINKSYTPKSYTQCYSKNGKGEYLQIIVKYLSNTKTIYLGSKMKVIIKLDKYINNLNEKNFEYKIGNFLSPIINKHFIKFSNPKKFQNTTYTFKDIIEVLELEDNS
jgi:predicted RNase H-like nuclease (RuvC/YqgF family)